jgi:hypothetical protein
MVVARVLQNLQHSGGCVICIGTTKRGMVMQYGRTTTKLNVRSDFPTAASSVLHGANLPAQGFNLIFIAERRPQLAIEIMRLTR